MSTGTPKEKLERTLNLGAALSLGMGTMIGAGIFVFPGIAAGYAGPAAMLSFAIAGLVAFLVAASTAELATAMPESGGGYYFVSRVLGSGAGTVIGIIQWLGLIFASAFYLVGFGEYTNKLLMETGFTLSDPVVLLALGSAFLLTGINITGTEAVGKLQNHVVMMLTVMLGLLFGYGILDSTGLTGTPQMPETFAPYGIFPVFTTAALIFTSYLGFVQIATVAGEITEPQKNLPRALMGSVVIVTVLYVTALFVSTSVLDSEELASLGETAMIAVAESLIGKTGAFVVLGAGLLATLSSANASILSSSRAIFALSKDELIPKKVSAVNKRFGTPHLALLSVGIPIGVLTLFNRVEILAEVASFFHLIIYSLICVSLLILRFRKPVWYAPTYRVPMAVFTAGSGALACAALIAFMQPLSIGVGCLLMVVAGGWYLLYARSTEISEPEPTHVHPSLRSPRILLPVEVPDPPSPPYSLLNAFRELKLFVLGYQLIPDQTSPEQAREEASEELTNSFEEYTGKLSENVADMVYELTFSKNISQTISKYVKEQQFQALLSPCRFDELKRILLPVYREDQINARVGTILRELARASKLPVSIVFIEGESEAEQSETGLEALETKARNQFVQSGLNDKQIRVRSLSVEDISEAVQQLAGDEDLVILAESDDDDPVQLFKQIHEKLRSELEVPTLLIFKEQTVSVSATEEQEKAEEVAT